MRCYGEPGEPSAMLVERDEVDRDAEQYVSEQDEGGERRL
jgi:hypothetical protein